MKNVLVTGALGFIAHHTILKLANNADQIFGIDVINNDTPIYPLQLHRLNLLKGIKNFRFIDMDLVDNKKLSQFFSNNSITHVMHLAALAGVRNSIINPKPYITANIEVTTNILNAIRSHHIKHFMMSSTSSIYGNQPTPFVENDNLYNPLSPYAATKAAAEILVKTYSNLYDIDAKILRYFTVYGPAGRPDMAIFKFIQAIDQGKTIEIFGDGNQTRDFTFVTDVANANIDCFNYPGFDLLNIGNGNKTVTVLNVIQTIEKLIGKKAKLEFKAANDYELNHTWSNSNKALEKIGWKAEVDINEGIEKVIKDYLHNREIYKKINSSNL